MLIPCVRCVTVDICVCDRMGQLLRCTLGRDTWSVMAWRKAVIALVRVCVCTRVSHGCVCLCIPDCALLLIEWFIDGNDRMLS